jgi:hypothetical protein
VSEPEGDDNDVELADMGYAAGPLLESLTIDPKVSSHFFTVLSNLKMLIKLRSTRNRWVS